MKMTKKDEYLVTDTGHLVAWSLAPPPHQFGDWSAVKGKIVTNQAVVQQWQITFDRELTATEVTQLTKDKLWWGMIVPNTPWALVMVRPSLGANTYQQSHPPKDNNNPFGRVGV